MLATFSGGVVDGIDGLAGGMAGRHLVQEVAQRAAGRQTHTH